MAAAPDLITQVSRTQPKPSPQTPLNGRPARPSIWSRLFCCVSCRSHAHAPPQDRATNGALPQQQPQQQQQQPAPVQWASQHPDPGQNLLPAFQQQDVGRKCLVLDLDETLVHSSFKPVANADFVVPIEIEGVTHHVYVLKRPHVDEFLKRLGDMFEIVLFTASLAKYADPVSDLLDTSRVFRHRLFRQHCVHHRGNYVKDLSRLGRDVNQTIIVDNSPASYSFHPENAIPVQSWFDDPMDDELLRLIPVLEQLADTADIYSVLRGHYPM